LIQLKIRSFIEELRQVSMLDDEVFDLRAQILKKSHASLIRVGFTEEQAIVIVAHQNFIDLRYSK